MDLGAARLPILLRMADYAEARRTGEVTRLVDYLGYQPWIGQRPTCDGELISPQALNALCKQALRSGQAVVILDGMDEITTDRDDIV